MKKLISKPDSKGKISKKSFSNEIFLSAKKVEGFLKKASQA